jgi:CubicO group peptidase (beta-lactamase class C family)
MKNRILKLVSIVVVSAAFFSVSCNTHTYFGRWMTWRASDIEDYTRFPSSPLPASSLPFRFTVDLRQELDQHPVLYKEGARRPLTEVLEETETTAFLVIINDTVVVEKYLNGYTRESINTSFSVAKSITSLLVGRALDDGFIHSIHDPVTKYIPELAKTDAGYEQLTLASLLDMRSGIQFKDHDMPWGDKPKAYYHPRLRERILELPIDFPPGSRFQYNSYNPILAGMILEKATGQSPAIYFRDKLWNDLGMEFEGSWSMDSEASAMTKMESGINLRAIDFAKFGRLILHRGSWNGDQVVSEGWIDACTRVTPENKVAEFGSEIHYSRFWWLYSKEGVSSYAVSGWGHLGQYLFVFPGERAVVVRMGKKIGSVDSWKAIAMEVVNRSHSLSN